MYIVNGNQLIFYNDCYHTSFEPHYRAYVLDNYSFSSKLIYHSSLFIHNSVHVHTSCVLDLSPHFVILPYALCVPVWFCKLFWPLISNAQNCFQELLGICACVHGTHTYTQKHSCSCSMHSWFHVSGLWEQAYRVYGHKLYTLYHWTGHISGVSTGVQQLAFCNLY